MLLQFTVSNFRAFRERQILSLTASNYDKSLPENCIAPSLPGLKRDRWVKGAAIYGANASGKSTVLEALKVLAGLVRSSAQTTDPKEPITAIEPFALAADAATEPSAFAVSFVTGSVRYEYRLAATRERIWHESLRAFPVGKEQTWFQRDWSPSTETYTWTPENPTGFTRDRNIEGRTLPNVLYLSKAVAENRLEIEPVFRWFKDRLIFIDLSTRSPAMPDGFTVRQLADATPHKLRIINLLRHADLGVTGAEVRQTKPVGPDFDRMLPLLPENLREEVRRTGNFLVYQTELLHRGSDGADHALRWESESAGTHRFFALAGPWLDIMARGRVVCIDELETSMHPLMVRELLRLFFSEKENPNRAQILFTTHNPLLLDPTLVRRDQVWFTDKDDEGKSHLYPLTDYQPRQGESLVRGYLSGRYGAVPFVPDGLLGSFPDQNSAPAEKENTASG
jgi:hypothetical protein